MLRRLAVVAGLCLLPVGNAVFALGLGEIKVTSGLNQRFEATIPFTSLTPDEADSLKVSLADNDAFLRAGLDRAQYLSSLTLEPVTDDGQPYIRIESSQIVREPLLTILIEVKAGGPRVLREYTVLLDPPGPQSNVSRPFARTEPVPKKQRDVPAPSEFYQAAKAKAAAEAPPPFVPGSTKYGPLRVGDTLWSIAQKVKPTGVSLAVEQVMLPLYNNNPDGFVDGNPNTLRKGAMLTVPTLDEMRKTDAVTAKEQVRALMAGEPLPGPAAASPPDATPAPTAPS
ncbi:MAG TPA: FimV/HubP family polar landmark protein, partial [Nevskiaceae bacterium]|nr:FimV/HubP family polar landmark protein [Nevskiaceae bacterium]